MNSRKPADAFEAELDRRIAELEAMAAPIRASLAPIEHQIEEIRSLKTGVDQYRRRFGEARDAALDDEPRSEEVQAEEDATPPARASTANGIKPPTADGPKPRRVDLLAEVLCEAKRSLTVAEMRAPMRAKGYGVGMEDHILYNSIYTALVKWSDRFRRIEGNRWELIE